MKTKQKDVRSEYLEKITDYQLLKQIDCILDSLSKEPENVKNAFMSDFNVLSAELKRRKL